MAASGISTMIHVAKLAGGLTATWIFGMINSKKNQERDRKHERMLVEAGWEVMTVWECELAAEGELSRKLDAFLQT
jgi:G:T-mismatch repair DNA endonuclease (very short patch repair protein)